MEQIESDDETAFGTDFAHLVKAQRALGWRQTLPISITTPELRVKLQPPDEYDLLARELDVVNPPINKRDEYQSFISQTPIAIDCSPLAWWLREE